MLSRFRAHRSAVLATAIASVLFTVTVAVPALGGPNALSAATLAQKVKKALKLSKQANKRSKQALNRAGEPGPQGPQGLQGLQGVQGVQGQQGTPGAPGSALGWAEINSGTGDDDGAGAPTDVAGKSSGNFVTVIRANAGRYCVRFTGLSRATNTAVVTVVSPSGGETTHDRSNDAQLDASITTGCQAADFIVRTGRVFHGASGSDDTVNNVSFSIAVY